MRFSRDKRNTERHSIAKEATIALPDGASACPAVLMDISPSGFKATVEAGIDVGQDVELLINANVLKAKIQWSRGGMIGCAFDEKLPRHKVLAISRGGYFGDTGSPSA
jgi:hypothetical protein